MNATPLPLLPVGRDCDCGLPMVWYGTEQRCAVYGTHSTPIPATLTFRDRSAPLSGVVDAVTALELPPGAKRSVAIAAGPHLRAVS